MKKDLSSEYVFVDARTGENFHSSDTLPSREKQQIGPHLKITNTSKDTVTFVITSDGASAYTADRHIPNGGDIFNDCVKENICAPNPKGSDANSRAFYSANNLFFNPDGTFKQQYGKDALQGLFFKVPPELRVKSVQKQESQMLPTPVATAPQIKAIPKVDVKDAVQGQSSHVNYDSLVDNVQENFWTYETPLVLAAVTLYTFRRVYGAVRSWKERRERGDRALVEALADFERRKSQREALEAAQVQRQKDARTTEQAVTTIKQTALDAMAERARSRGGVHRLSEGEKNYLKTLIGGEKMKKVEEVSSMLGDAKKIDNLKKKKGGMGAYLGAIDALDHALDGIAAAANAQRTEALQKKHNTAFSIAGSALGEALGLKPDAETEKIVHYIEKRPTAKKSEGSSEPSDHAGKAEGEAIPSEALASTFEHDSTGASR